MDQVFLMSPADQYGLMAYILSDTICKNDQKLGLLPPGSPEQVCMNNGFVLSPSTGMLVYRMVVIRRRTSYLADRDFCNNLQDALDAYCYSHNYLRLCLRGFKRVGTTHIILALTWWV